MPNEEAPLSDVMKLKRGGANSEEIMQSLKEKDMGDDEISNAMNQAKIKEGVGSYGSPSMIYEEAPSPTSVNEERPVYREEPPAIPFSPQRMMGSGSENIGERIHEVAEAAVNEKWEEFMGRIGDITIWKERVGNDLLSIKQEILRMDERFRTLQKAVLGKVDDYDKNIMEVGTEVKALGKVFEKIIEPLTTNIKDLERITEKLKGKK